MEASRRTNTKKITSNASWILVPEFLVKNKTLIMPQPTLLTFSFSQIWKHRWNSNFKDSSRPKNGIKAWIFSCDNFLELSTWCIDELNSIFGDQAPSRTSVYRWYGGFNLGCSYIKRISWRSFKTSCCSGNNWCCAPTDIARLLCDLSWNIDNLRH